MNDIIEKLKKMKGWHQVPRSDSASECVNLQYSFVSHPTALEAADELERLSAENERLREALEKIATTQGGGDCCSAYEWFVHTKQIARAALAEKGEK